MQRLTRLQQLLEGYLQDKCTDDDRQELMAMIREEKNAGYITEFIRKWMDSHTEEDTSNLEPARSEEIFNKVMQSGLDRQLPVKPMFDWRKVAAALVILLGAAVLIYSLVNGRTEPVADEIVVAPQVDEQDISAGTTGAILILGDGRKVVLDSLQNGTITKQGNSVVEIKNGTVHYASEEMNAVTVYNTMTTPRGRKYRLELSDGTVVWLNAESAITFPTSFPDDERAVSISGEAYFEVARHVDKPFIVKVGEKQKIKVLGTHFNINAYENEAAIRTTLLHGSIQVEAETGNSVILKPGQQATTTANGMIHTRNNADLDEVVAWKNGFFHFQNADIKAVMRQLSRWYDVEVSYPATLPDWRFTGEIGEKLTLKEVLEGLAFTNIKFKIDGRKLILLPQ